LSQKEIFRAIKEKRIKITPFERSFVGACSVDFRLGSKFKFFRKACEGVSVSESFKRLPENAYEEKTLRHGESLELVPNELVLGCTLERLMLSNGLCARIEGRSSIARAGLLVHVSSSLVQPGVDNVQVLELMNVSPVPLRVSPGARVCQIVFEELRGEAAYKGKFAKQNAP
jgi:dCTP deaminase